MLTVWIIVAFVVFHVFNYLMAVIQMEIVHHRQAAGNPKQIEHWLWALIYCMLVSPFYFLHNWYLIGSLLVLHFHVFGMAYQHLNGNNIFYLSKTSKAITEKILIGIGCKSAEKPYLISAILSIYLLIKSILNG